MNRQPFFLAGGISSQSYYDEDLDQREVLANGVILVYMIRSNIKKPKGPLSFQPYFVTPDQSEYLGYVTNRTGINIVLWRLNVEIRRLETRDHAIDLAKRLVLELYK